GALPAARCPPCRRDPQPAPLSSQQALEVVARIEVALCGARPGHRLGVGPFECRPGGCVAIGAVDHLCVPATPLVAPDLLPESFADPGVALGDVDVVAERSPG